MSTLIRDGIRAVLAAQLLEPIKKAFKGEQVRYMALIEGQYIVLTNTAYCLVNTDGSFAKRITYTEYLRSRHG